MSIEHIEMKHDNIKAILRFMHFTFLGLSSSHYAPYPCEHGSNSVSINFEHVGWRIGAILGRA